MPGFRFYPLSLREGKILDHPSVAKIALLERGSPAVFSVLSLAQYGGSGMEPNKEDEVISQQPAGTRLARLPCTTKGRPPPPLLKKIHKITLIFTSNTTDAESTADQQIGAWRLTILDAGGELSGAPGRTFWRQKRYTLSTRRGTLCRPGDEHSGARRGTLCRPGDEHSVKILRTSGRPAEKSPAAA